MTDVEMGSMIAEQAPRMNKDMIRNLKKDLRSFLSLETNRDSIKQNIYKCVNTEYYKVYSIFSAYEHDDVNVSTSIKEEWIDDTTSECLRIIYNGQDSVSRIRQLNNKLNIITEEYSIYIKNKVFNH